MNDAPVAKAGSDASVIEGKSINLDATASSDPDTGDTLTYNWLPVTNLNDAIIAQS